MEEAFASRESDRRMILNSIAGVKDLTTSPAESHVGSLVRMEDHFGLMILDVDEKNEDHDDEDGEKC